MLLQQANRLNYNTKSDFSHTLLEDLGAEHIPYSIDMDGLNIQVREKSTHALRTTLARVPIGSSAWQPVPLG